MNEWLEASIPIRGRVFVRMEGLDLDIEIASFEQRVPIRIEAPEGEVPATIKFTSGP